MAFGDSAKGVEVLAAAARTANATSGGVDAWAANRARGGVFLLSVGAAAGTTPTLDVRLQHADNDVAAEYTDIPGAAFGQKTGVSFQELNVQNTKRFIRAIAAIGGGTPSFTFSLTGVLGDPLEEPV